MVVCISCLDYADAMAAKGCKQVRLAKQDEIDKKRMDLRV